MRTRFAFWVCVLLFLAAAAAGPASGVSGAPRVRYHRIDGMIHTVTAAIFERALNGAAADGDALFLLELDTPGGMVDSTETMVQAMLNSKIPIVVWVGPRGAHAASAGFFLLLTADVAAMAPVTRTGASSVITLGGENKEGDIALKKASEDLSALIRTTARMRGRPAELAEKAVREARSWSAEEALDAKLIDLIADNRDDLIKKLDGREIVRPNGEKIRLDLKGAQVIEHRLRWAEGFKNVVLHPSVMAILFMIAVLGIYAEFSHPGMIFPGVIGAVALLIFLYGSQVLPVSFLAAALVAVGLVMFILELKVVSHGLLTIGGVAAVGVGLYLLFPSNIPGLAVPLGLFVPMMLFLAVFVGFVTFLVKRALSRPPTTGREGIVGEIGRSTSALDPEGTIHVHGEVWRARAGESLPKDCRVRVVGSEGLMLIVERADGRGHTEDPHASNKEG